MYKIKEVIVVEGTYDKIKLSSFLDAVIVCTGGFSVFTNDETVKMIQKLADASGVVILTDSDSAGFKIRNYIKQKLPTDKIKHAYIPDIQGKEKRKTKAGKEGILGVEGINKEIILDSLIKAGCQIEDIIDNVKEDNCTKQITKLDFFKDGLSGGENSINLRKELLLKLNLPSKLSANMLLDVINRLISYDEYKKNIEQIKNIPK